jgi:hypothetical protein
MSLMNHLLQGMMSDRPLHRRFPRPRIDEVVGKARKQRRRFKVAMDLCHVPNRPWSMYFIHDEVVVSATAVQLWSKLVREPPPRPSPPWYFLTASTGRLTPLATRLTWMTRGASEEER